MDAEYFVAEAAYNRAADTYGEQIVELRKAGAVLLRAIYESGMAYEDPEIAAALTVFAGS